MIFIRAILLLCLILTMAQGQKIRLSWVPDSHVANYAVEYSTNGFSWQTVTQGVHLTSCVLPALGIQASTDCSVHNFYRLRFDLVTNMEWRTRAILSPDRTITAFIPKNVSNQLVISRYP